MSDSSDEGEPFQLRDLTDDSDDERPNKRRKTARQPALRSKGLGFVIATAQAEESEDEEEEDPDDARPTMGGFRSAFNIGQYNDEASRKSPSPEMDSEAQAPNLGGRGPSAFGTGGRIQKNSFAARMMAKQGYVEGQGLGKAGQGITAPIQQQVLQSRAGLGAGAGAAPEKPRRTKSDKGKNLQAPGSGASTPRLKPPPRAKYAVSAIESRGLHIPDAIKSVIIDATGAEARTVTSLSGFSTPTSESGPPTEAAKASARIKMQLQAYADAWDATQEQEARLELEEAQIQAAATLHLTEQQKYQDVISEFERVSMDDSNESREWEQIMTRLRDIQEQYADLIEDLDLPQLTSACLESPFRRQLAEWDALNEPANLVDSFQSIGALLEIEKAINSRHRRRTTPFESLLIMHWYPYIRSALKHWNVYDPDQAFTLVDTWTPILPPWLVYKVLHEIILPKLIEAVRRFPKLVEGNNNITVHSSTTTTNGSSSSSSSKNRKAPDMHSWLFEWWSLLSRDDLDLERFPELRTLVKNKVDSQSWPVWKPHLGSSRRSATAAAAAAEAEANKKKKVSSALSSAAATPAATMEDVSFKDIVEDWCSENNLILRSSQKADVFGRLLYRLQDAERRSKGILVYLQEDVVFSEEGEPYALDHSLAKKAMGT